MTEEDGEDRGTTYVMQIIEVNSLKDSPGYTPQRRNVRDRKIYFKGEKGKTDFARIQCHKRLIFSYKDLRNGDRLCYIILG